MPKPPRFNAGVVAKKEVEEPAASGLRDFSKMHQTGIDPDPATNAAVAELIDEAPVHSAEESRATPEAPPAPIGTTPIVGALPGKKKDRPRYYLEEDESRLDGLVSEHMRLTGEFSSASRMIRAAIRHLEGTTTAEQRALLVAGVPDKRRKS